MGKNRITVELSQQFLANYLNNSINLVEIICWNCEIHNELCHTVCSGSYVSVLIKNCLISSWLMLFTPIVVATRQCQSKKLINFIIIKMRNFYLNNLLIYLKRIKKFWQKQIETHHKRSVVNKYSCIKRCQTLIFLLLGSDFSLKCAFRYWKLEWMIVTLSIQTLDSWAFESVSKWHWLGYQRI